MPSLRGENDESGETWPKRRSALLGLTFISCQRKADFFYMFLRYFFEDNGGFPEMSSPCPTAGRGNRVRARAGQPVQRIDPPTRTPSLTHQFRHGHHRRRPHTRTLLALIRLPRGARVMVWSVGEETRRGDEEFLADMWWISPCANPNVNTYTMEHISGNVRLPQGAEVRFDVITVRRTACSGPFP